MPDAVNLLSTNGARRFGVYPHKGHIGVGADADLVLYDPAADTTIHRDMLFSKARDCDRLYEGRTFRGRVRRTLVMGRTVFTEGRVTGQPGDGHFVRPDAAAVDRGF